MHACVKHDASFVSRHDVGVAVSRAHLANGGSASASAGLKTTSAVPQKLVKQLQVVADGGSDVITPKLLGPAQDLAINSGSIK